MQPMKLDENENEETAPELQIYYNGRRCCFGCLDVWDGWGEMKLDHEVKFILFEDNTTAVYCNSWNYSPINKYLYSFKVQRRNLKMRHQDQLKMGTVTTLDEPVLTTIMRDLNQVRDKLKVVLLPLGAESQESVLQKLRDWDLWGPLLVCLTLSTILSITAPGDTASLVFAAVFVIVWCGAAAVTLNAQLLGGSISFFQSVCILGYCVFPLTLSALGCLIMSFIYKHILIKMTFALVGFIWSTRASVVFMSQVIKEERKTLAVFPVFFFYTFIAWMVLLQ